MRAAIPAERRRRRTAGLASVAVATGVVAAGCSSSPPPAAPVARAFLASWAAGNYPAAGRRTDAAPAAVAAALRRLATDLQLTSTSLRLGRVRAHGDRGVAAFTATLGLRGLGDWRYAGSLPLRRTGDGWRVHFGPATIHPALAATGSRLVRSRELPERGALLDAAGQPLFAATPVVAVGIRPGGLTDRAGTLALLARTTGADPARVAVALSTARPTDFVPVITLRRPAYDAVRAQLHEVPGLVFRAGTALLPPTTGFARALLGRVGESSAEVLRRAGPGYQPGDQLGLSGLQAAFQDRLTGRATGAVTLVDAVGAPIKTLVGFSGRTGVSVRTTLDRAVQLAAETALTGVSRPAALVAVRPSDGAVLAVANRPTDSALNRAFTGRYPPGSTFKVVTTAALLAGGLRPTEPVACPPTISIDGKTFRNFEAESSGPVPFRRDFAESCNTAFLGLARRLDAGSLGAAATALGVGAGWTLPVSAFAGTLPAPDGPVDLAADMIGQGRVLVSPLTLALVAAAVASGEWRPPVLVRGPTATAAAPPKPLDPSVVQPLRELMRAVVAEGSAAAALGRLPGPPVAGKTGTAEFGSGNPPATHAWFIGYRGDLAFAILVEGGGVGGRVAAPLAARFLTALPAR